MPSLTFQPPFLFAAASIVFVVCLCVNIIKRKHSLRHHIISVCLFLVTSFFVLTMVQSLSIGEPPQYWGFLYSKVPFGNLFLPFVTKEVEAEFRPLFYPYFIVTAAFSILWGFLVPFLQKKPSYRSLMILSAAIWIPSEIVFALLVYFGYTYNPVFDTGCFIVLFLGFSLGWLLYQTLGKPMLKRKKAQS